jgi:hypothetical protein
VRPILRWLGTRLTACWYGPVVGVGGGLGCETEAGEGPTERIADDPAAAMLVVLGAYLLGVGHASAASQRGSVRSTQSNSPTQPPMRSSISVSGSGVTPRWLSA